MRLASAGSPRLIFIGGSNLLYGLDCRKVRRELRYEPVNMGECYLFGLPYIISEIIDSLRPGDVVILSPEPQLFCDLDDSSGFTTSILETYPGAIRWVLPWALHSWKRTEALLTSMRRIGAKKATYWARHAADITSGKWTWQPDEKNSYVDCQKMDAFGDFFGHIQQKSKGSDGIDCVLYGPELKPKGAEMKALFRLKRECDRRGAKLGIVPCPMPRKMYEQDKIPLDGLYKGLEGYLPGTVLASQARYAFPIETFFNSQYHLQEPGRTERTERLIEDLRPLLRRGVPSVRRRPI